MKVLKEGTTKDPVKDWSMHATCECCNAKLAIDAEDLKFVPSVNKHAPKWRVACGYCQITLPIDPLIIPDFVRNFVYTKFGVFNYKQLQNLAFLITNNKETRKGNKNE